MPLSDPADPLLRRDVGHSLLVATLAVLLSAGLLYGYYVGRVWRVARRSPQQPDADGTLLLFGKRLVDGGPDPDYRQRLQHARQLAMQRPGNPLILLGGGPQGATEAEAGLAWLHRHGLPATVPVRLEDRSLDTLQNLRNARAMLTDRATPVLLLSNRYHLARCLALARSLGLDARPCAAEPEFRWREQRPGRLLLEAAYLCWLEVGRGWARLLGHRRMLERIS